MDADDAVTPAELRGTLLVIGDINEKVMAIGRLLEEDDDGEAEEDDA